MSKIFSADTIHFERDHSTAGQERKPSLQASKSTVPLAWNRAGMLLITFPYQCDPIPFGVGQIDGFRKEADRLRVR